MGVLEKKAKKFATYHHGAIGHKRLYTFEPYISHPAAVVALVKSVPHSEEMLAAAWLHDVVEDTPVSIEMIASEFGEKVAELVGMLTNVSKPSDGSRAVRKAIDKAHLAHASPEAKTIKIADIIHNTSSIAEHDPKFAAVYIKEKIAVLEVLKGGDPVLLAAAKKALTKA